ncbi:ribosome recycling factor [Pseudoclavibacter chungangensis]|uniref:Ribosome-recycling factor n=1 Tax=Pseudoclavibacter chungangensis TaxID=587635 RepID=A0A7J5BYY8_9MICO|nr:ribosome recycling factor [Pseudoclavibacter chungangensis]KAB1659566.1 ribosome recycling factor [Pseudoclavibacter chungangensis]NYJ67386.1 ribosome recycling factor [Pseudoclavibacter chungangensis]
MIKEVLEETTEKMTKAVEHAREDFSTVRTGRVNPALFQKLTVDYYGSPTPLEQLASLQVPEARVLVVTPYDKSALKEIEKTIATAPNLGVTPSNDGNIVRVVMPELTADRRKEYVKLANSKAEEARVAIRNIRRKAKTDLDALRDEVGEDDVTRAEKELEASTKQFIERIDEALKNKEAELLEV